MRKTVRISMADYFSFDNPSPETFINSKLEEAGFDLKKPFTVYNLPDSHDMLYEQITEDVEE